MTARRQAAKPGRALPRLLLGTLLWGLGGCLSGRDGPLPDASLEGGAGPEVLIGVPDGLDFVPLEDGGDVPLETFGQGGTHARLAVRCIDLGDSAFVDVTLENLESGETVMTVPSNKPMLLLCREDGPCDALPVLVMTGGLADPDEKDGLAIRITADVHNEAGASASASVEAVLRQQF